MDADDASKTGPINRFTPEITASLAAGAIGFAVGGPLLGAVGAVVGGIASAIVDAVSKQRQKTHSS